MFDLVGKRHLFFLISGLAILPGLVSLALPGGIRPGIDFSSGTILTLRFEREVVQGDLRDELAKLGHSEAIVQWSGEGDYLVRTRPLTQEIEAKEGGQAPTATERQTLVDNLSRRFGPVQVLTFDQVSPLVAEEVVRNAFIAVVAACLGILGYLTIAFWKVKKSYRYGACAVAALIHDSLLVLGVFSILGRFFNVEIDAMFITAVLTVIGFSVHDTIVVFDRIRENIARHVGEPFEDIVNHSLVQTLGRSLNTSITVLLTLVTLRLFGGVTIHSFVLALLIGITAGTYSSIFNASMLLVVWEKGDLARLFRRSPRARAAA